MADKKLITSLRHSPEATALTRQAAYEIIRLETELQKAVNDRNAAWFSLEESRHLAPTHKRVQHARA